MITTTVPSIKSIRLSSTEHFLFIELAYGSTLIAINGIGIYPVKRWLNRFQKTSQRLPEYFAHLRWVFEKYVQEISPSIWKCEETEYNMRRKRRTCAVPSTSRSRPFNRPSNYLPYLLQSFSLIRKLVCHSKSVQPFNKYCHVLSLFSLTRCIWTLGSRM